MRKPAIAVRPFTGQDVPELLRLMGELAVFEDYIDEFAVTEKDIVARGLCAEPQFQALVAPAAETRRLAGMAVLYTVPYTYTLKPDMVLKELYVVPDARGRGIGAALFDAAGDLARRSGCGQLVWTVMAGNATAESFYLERGGRPDDKWRRWAMGL